MTVVPHHPLPVGRCALLTDNLKLSASVAAMMLCMLDAH